MTPFGRANKLSSQPCISRRGAKSKAFRNPDSLGSMLGSMRFSGDDKIRSSVAPEASVHMRAVTGYEAVGRTVIEKTARLAKKAAEADVQIQRPSAKVKAKVNSAQCEYRI